MKYLLTVLVVVACVLSFVECQKKAPKSVKSLRRLCNKAVADNLDITDGNYTDVFDDLTEWCPDFLANFSDYFTNKAREGKPYDPIKEMKKVCAYYEKKYGDDEPLAIFDGLGDICYDFEYAYNVSEGIISPIDNGTPTPTPTAGPTTEAPVKTPKAIQKLELMCKKADKGKLKWRNDSYDAAFDELIAWCPDYLQAIDDGAEWPYAVKERKYNAEKELGVICGFVDRKFPEGFEEGDVLDGIDDVCALMPYIV